MKHSVVAGGLFGDRALQRIAFSPIVREAGDLANGLFDARARMVAQAVTGTPGHINSLAAAAANLLRHVEADSLKPGDVLITNDPWMSAGHFFDITVLSPIFRGARLIGYAGSTIHHTDIGGYGIGSGARDSATSCFEVSSRQTSGRAGSCGRV